MSKGWCEGAPNLFSLNRIYPYTLRLFEPHSDFIIVKVLAVGLISITSPIWITSGALKPIGRFLGGAILIAASPSLFHMVYNSTEKDGNKFNLILGLSASTVAFASISSPDNSVVFFWIQIGIISLVAFVLMLLIAVSLNFGREATTAPPGMAPVFTSHDPEISELDERMVEL
jgi:hypothetical protein